jgi:hypothetical protein
VVQLVAQDDTSDHVLEGALPPVLGLVVHDEGLIARPNRSSPLRTGTGRRAVRPVRKGVPGDVCRMVCSINSRGMRMMAVASSTCPPAERISSITRLWGSRQPAVATTPSVLTRRRWRSSSPSSSMRATISFTNRSPFVVPVHRSRRAVDVSHPPRGQLPPTSLGPGSPR